MSGREARTPFHLIGCWELAGVLGRRAWDERELLEHLEEVPPESIYFHTHSVFLRERAPAPYPNDFATWAAIQVRDRVLGEKLGILEPEDFSDIEAVRTELVSLIDDHLSEVRAVPRVMFGQPFHFMQSRLLEIPTGVKVRTLAGFRDAVAEADLAVLYLHVVEARARKGRRRNDFATWLGEHLGLADLGAAVARLTASPLGLEAFRHRLVGLCDAALRAGHG